MLPLPLVHRKFVFGALVIRPKNFSCDLPLPFCKECSINNFPFHFSGEDERPPGARDRRGEVRATRHAGRKRRKNTTEPCREQTVFYWGKVHYRSIKVTFLNCSLNPCQLCRTRSTRTRCSPPPVRATAPSAPSSSHRRARPASWAASASRTLTRSSGSS